MVLIVMMLLFTLAAVAGGNDYWTQQCPASCRCLWSGGKKVAECNQVGLTTIPDNLSDEIQVLSLNDNKIHSLTKDAFLQVKLVHLHKLFLRRSHIVLVDKDALSGMKVLIELDLSHNKIEHLHRDLFRECEKIREVVLSHNPVQRIDEGLFADLKFLQNVDLKNCQIKKIDVGSFVNVPLFLSLDLRGNQLSFLDLNAVRDLGKMQSLSLMDNPWRCDCNLRQLRTWVLERKLCTDPILCKNVNKSWKDMTESEFACAPEVLSVGQEGWSLSCHVKGDPQPTVEWFFNGKPVNNHSYTGAEYLFRKSPDWFNLTVRHARSRDNGEYKCLATNEGGNHDGRLDVNFLNNDDDEMGGFGVPGAVADVWPLIVGVVLGAVLLLVVVLVVCCCFCKNHQRVAGKKDANGTVGALEAEEKTLMHSVNPVQKPPRRQETALNTSETELLDAVSLPYNENGSILGSTLNDSQLDTSMGRAPDLITIPGKTLAVSPTTKPLTQFGTLPYARSHSPFSPPAPVVPRSGYVTIPRRPRVPSWTASLSPVVSPDDTGAIVEPVYDNLGPRTTADGSSVLSLNKVDLGLPAAYKNRPLPLAPYESMNEHRRQSWSRGTPDISDERQLLIATSPQPSIAPAKKIPPNPPPKPKKKPGKLFDDEGEDGTEV